MTTGWLSTFSNCSNNAFASLHRTTHSPQRSSIFSRARVSLSCQASMETIGDAVVVGAGPAGCLITHYLLKRGFRVQVFERYPPMQQTFSADNPDKRLYPAGDNRSYPMVISTRAFTALEGAGLEVPSTLFKETTGSCTHLANGKKVRMNYSETANFKNYSTSRNALVSFLQQTVLERIGENLSIHFGFELIELNSDVRVAYFSKSKCNLQNEDKEEGHKLEVQFDLLVGADGISSKVRSEIMRLDKLQNKNSPMTMEFEKSPASYKTFYISPSNARTSPLFEDQDRVQGWPPLNMLLVNLPDGSFWGGSRNEKLINSQSPAEVEMLFRNNAPEVFELLLKENANFVEDFIKQTAIPFGGAVKLSQFHKDNVVLIGDAAHAMFPAYGTGCNAALEDCLILDSILGELSPGNGGVPPVAVATSEFTKKRLEDAHAIVDMNTHGTLFRRGPLGLLQIAFYKTLQRLFPQLVGPTAYELLLSTVPFSKIKQKVQREIFFFYVVIALFATAVIFVSLMVLKRVTFVK